MTRQAPALIALGSRFDPVILGFTANGDVVHRLVPGAYPVSVSPVAIVLLLAAVVLVAATEWPSISRRVGIDTSVRRERKLRKSHLRVVKTETDDFAKAVERDLAKLPTIDDRD